MRCPGRLILNDHQPLKRVEIVPHCVVFQRAIRSARVAGKRCGCRVGRDVARKTAQQLTYLGGVSSHTIDATNVNAADLVEVVAYGSKRREERQAAEPRPTTDCDLLDEVRDAQARIAASRRIAGEQFAERDIPSARAYLEETHRTQS
jgi:hypothetical protein